MEPISGTDRLLALLRQKLEERAKAGSSHRGSTKLPPNQSREPSGVQAYAAIDGHDERQLRRALVQHLLGEQFGSELLNDAHFQQIVTRVTDAIEEDEGAARLLSGLVQELKPS